MSWLSDGSANKLKNSYVQDINNEGYALDVCGNVIIRNEQSLRFENPATGTYIGKEILSNLVDGSSNIVIGNNVQYNRLKQWVTGTIPDGSWNSVAFGNNTIVAVGGSGVGGNKIAYSTDIGSNWTIAGFDFPTNEVGIQFIEIEKIGGGNFNINEIQVWFDGVNEILNSNADTKLQDGHLLWRDNNGDSFFDSSSVEIEFTKEDLKYSGLQAIVLYSAKSNTNVSNMGGGSDNSNVRITLRNAKGDIAKQITTSSNDDYYVFTGLNYASASLVGHSSSTNIITNTTETYDLNFDKLRIRRLTDNGNDNNINLNKVQVWKRLNPIGTDLNDVSFNQIVLISTASSGVNFIEKENVTIYLNDGIDVSFNVGQTSSGGMSAGSELNAEYFVSGFSSLAVATLSNYINLKNIQFIQCDNIGSGADGNQPILSSSIFRLYNSGLEVFIDLSFNFSFDDNGSGEVNKTKFIFYGPKYASYDINNFTINDYARFAIPSLNHVNIVNYDNISSSPSSSNYNLDDINTSWSTPNSTINNTIDIPLTETISNNELKSIVVYPDTNYLTRMKGVSLELVNNTNKIFEYLIWDTNADVYGTTNVYRINGVSNNIDTTLDVVDINDASYNDILNIVSDSYIIDTSNIHHIETTINVNNSELGGSDIDQSLVTTLNSVAYGNNRFVAVGDQVILQATDGSLNSWKGTYFQVADGGKTEDFKKVVYNNDKFVAIAPNINNANIQPLTNSVNWNTNTTSNWTPISGTLSQSNWSSIAYHNATNYVAVSNSTTNNVSVYDGSSWSTQTVNVTNGLLSIAYGLNKYVAVGPDILIYSTDNGASWSIGSTQTGNWVSVKFIAATNLFVAVSTTEEKRVIYSEDGINWILSNVEQSLWKDITYTNAEYVAVAESGTSQLLLNFGRVANSIAIGNGSQAEYFNSIAIGKEAIAPGENTVILGGPASQGLIIPKGTTSERPIGEVGMIRFNTETGAFEGYNGTTWVNLSTP